MPSYKLHQEKREYVESLVKNGLTKTEIADKSGIPHGSINHYLEMWGLKTKRARIGQSGNAIVHSGKYDHLFEKAKELASQGTPVFQIADILGIPRGSIGHTFNRWNIKGLSRKTRGSHFTSNGKKRLKEAIRKSHKSGNRISPYKGKVALRGEWVTREEFIAEAKGLIDQDMTYKQMCEILGVSQATLWARLKEADLLQGLRSGDRTHMWRGGHRKYRGPGWQKRRLECLRRDGFICQDCGRTNAEELKELHRQLSAHHIIPWEESLDSSLDNLVTLCQSCHMKREYKEGRFNSF